MTHTRLDDGLNDRTCGDLLSNDTHSVGRWTERLKCGEQRVIVRAIATFALRSSWFGDIKTAKRVRGNLSKAKGEEKGKSCCSNLAQGKDGEKRDGEKWER
ncbi:hypothetical protein RRG08_060839 [Elysia crispata]|uniref:Uncharacterized protein n=1 Tax=Elysia crispata TaxID=231223 RepID=A0AAE0ZHI8_9GAST|nr:hypothetical protein RRG08_060839 [Elysia crispata]